MGRPTQHTFPLSSFFGGRATRVRYAIPEPHTPPAGRGVAARDRVAAVIAAGTRPDLPFRTRKLRLPAPMVLHPPGCGRVGHRRQTTTKGGAAQRPPLSCRLPPHARGCPRPRRQPARRHGRQPPHRQTPRQTTNTPPDADAAAGVLSVTPAINTARQTTNTPTTGMLVESDLLL